MVIKLSFLSIIGSEDKNKKIITIFLKKIYKKLCILIKPLGITTTFKPNFYYIVYDMICVRTRFDLNPKREWIQAHVAQTMNL